MERVARTDSSVSPERKAIEKIFRSELRWEDCRQIAKQNALNRKADEPLWCPSLKLGTAPGVWANHAVILRTRGIPVIQVHEGNGRLVSYFAGSIDEKRNRAIFSIGVVNLDNGREKAKEIWRRDGAVFLRDLLKGNPEVGEIVIIMSSDKPWIAEWAERDLGLEREGRKKKWTGSREVAEDYVKKILYLGQEATSTAG